jgi:RNA polymerase sigma-70 factor (ECF subfamily)
MTTSFSLSWSNLVIPISSKSVKIEQLSNTDLIIRCQEGRNPDKIAFAELLRRYQSHIDRILYHLAPDWNDRADLAQEVWIRVYKKISHLHDPRKFRSWLTTITTRLFYDQLRKRKKYKGNISLDAPLPTDDGELNWELPSDSPSPEDNLNTREFYEQLQKAIADLPETFRTTIVLREIQGLSYEEIAQITGVSLGTVKSRIARARLKLQTILQPYI